MDDFERLLKDAMARQEAPAHFEARVLAAVARGQAPRSGFRAWFTGPLALRMATVTLAVALVAGGVTWQNERERRAGEEARAKLELALRITSEKLGQIDREIASAGQ
jgi:hypothetical protein